VRAELHLAGRYLLGLRRRTHVVTVSLISLGGLALGVLALVVTLALLEGFQSSIRSGLEDHGVHARVTPAEGRRLAEPERLVSVLQEALGVVEQVEVVRGSCLVSARGSAVPASVVGRSDAAGVSVDRALAARLGVGRGDEVDLVSSRQRLTPMGPLPIRLRHEVAGVVHPEPGAESGSVLLPLEEAQRLLWGEPVVEAVELRDPADPWGLGERVRRALRGSDAGLRVEDLEELHRPLLVALAMERAVIFLAVGLMLVVAALNLLCNVAMIAASKRRDLAVLAGLGLEPDAMRRLFLAMGLGIGAAGALVGATLGTTVAVVLDRLQAVPLPRGVFTVSAVPFAVEPEAVAAVVVAALVLALIASWLPSRLVAQRDPTQGLRHE
jgi:lipoprotein-releasing system permease protein